MRREVKHESNGLFHFVNQSHLLMIIFIHMTYDTQVLKFISLKLMGIIFQGGKIRDLLFQLLEGESDVFIKHGSQSRESRRMATQGMHTSKFCLHPAGDTPSACRLFDAIVSLCVPVIISDYIELPFEDVIDYRKIAVFVDTESALKPGYLTKLLRRVKKDQILEFQKELKKVLTTPILVKLIFWSIHVYYGLHVLVTVKKGFWSKHVILGTC